MVFENYIAKCSNSDDIMVIQEVNGHIVYLSDEDVEKINELVWERDEQKRKKRLASKNIDVV